jgi:glycosyltransferase involved in cell wall biosynthesis
MKVSIITANYNYARYLKTAIDSVLAQTYQDVEIIIVDDGSTDNSREVITQLQQKSPEKIKAIFQSNQGQGAAFNTGFAAATGDIVAFLDADDVWKPNKLQQVIETFCNNDVVGVMHPLDVIDANSDLISSEPGPQLSDDLAKVIVETGNAWYFPPTSGLAFRRSVLKKVFPLRWSEWPDGFMIYSAAFLGKIKTLNEMLGSYRHHGANTHVSQQLTPETEAKMLAGTEITNEYINEFLEDIGYPDRVDLSRNLQYQRAKYYARAQWDTQKVWAISRLILGWTFYNPKEKAYYLARFLAKSVGFLLRPSSYQQKTATS